VKVYLYLVISFFKYLATKSYPDRLVWDDLINKFSYKYDKNISDSYKALFTFYGLTIRKILQPESKKNSGSHELIIDLKQNGVEQRIDYLEYSFKITTTNTFAKETDTIELSLTQRIGLITISSILLLLILILSLFTKKRAQIGLIPLEALELFILAKYIQRNNIKQVHFFSPFEKDTCFITNYLKNHLEITVILYPSANPISNFYTNVIATKFAYNMPYQLQEYESLKRNWLVDQLIYAPIHKFNEIIKTGNRPTTVSTIGFLSSGNWLRKKEKRTDPGKGYFEAENNLMYFLKEYLNLNKNIKLVIYFHPIEKRNEDITKESIKYFTDFFGSTVQFAPTDVPSRELPELVDIAVSPYSSSMYERLYAGYKVLFSQKGMSDDFFVDDRLKKITGNNQSEFNDLVNQMLTIDADTYFRIFDLSDYRFDANKVGQSITLEQSVPST
jgi:hypothetical protein